MSAMDDFEAAERGFIDALPSGSVHAADGREVWNGDAYAFLDGERPETVNASLWRQSRLTAKQGLFEVTPGVYQVRGLDLSNISFIEGDSGVIVVDPLLSTETAAAALALYREHRGDRPVTAVLYTHSHVDHFGGVLGVVGRDTDVPILAPAGFLEHAVSENVHAGPAMARRSILMYGSALPKGPRGQVGCGLGQTTSTGTVSLLPPTHDVTHTGQEETLDGVRFLFQLTPGTEAPAEMNFLLTDRRVLCMAENATHNLHNLLTLRGAPVRDPRTWADYLTEAIELFADRADTLFASHHWPTFGQVELTRFLTEQRDLYAYLHDQTLRLINQGHTGVEIAEMIELPPRLEKAWHTKGYYGSVSHNVKAIYQLYMGWFDGNPAHLWEHPPAESAVRYVECMGGASTVQDKARSYADRGDLRFAATLLNHVVFADSRNRQAREQLAGVYERLGFGAENGPWRNFYLQGAAELRGDVPKAERHRGGSDATLTTALTAEQFFDGLAVRLNGPRAWQERFVIDWRLTDLGRTIRLRLANGVLVRTRPSREVADLTLTLTRAQLPAVLGGRRARELRTEGDAGLLDRLLGLLDRPRRDFPIVTP